jgi:hypothetical protein
MARYLYHEMVMRGVLISLVTRHGKADAKDASTEIIQLTAHILSHRNAQILSSRIQMVMNIADT